MRRLLAALLAALLLSGCAALAEPEEVWEGYQPFLPEEPEEEEVPPEEPEYPAAFSLPYYRDQTLDPIACGEGVQETAASLLYEPLFRLDERDSVDRIIWRASYKNVTPGGGNVT